MITKQTQIDNKPGTHINLFDSRYDNRVMSLGTVERPTLAQCILGNDVP